MGCQTIASTSKDTLTASPLSFISFLGVGVPGFGFFLAILQMASLQSQLPAAKDLQDRILAIAKATELEVFGTSVPQALGDPTLLALSRDLDLVSLWGGCGAIVAVARGRGCNGVVFDIKQSPDQDFTKPAGFRHGLELVFRLKPWGLLTTEPECSSFVFANTSGTGRRKDNPAGNESVKCVQRGNLFAREAVFFLLVALCRSVHCMLEQPPGSLMWVYLKEVLDQLAFLMHDAIGHRCAYTKELNPNVFYKPYKFRASWQWQPDALQRCTCLPQMHQPLMIKGADGRVTGHKKHLKESAMYPLGLAQDLFAAWRSTPHHYQKLTLASAQKKNKRTKATSEVDDGPWGNAVQEASTPSATGSGILGSSKQGPVISQMVNQKPNFLAVAVSKKRPRPAVAASGPWGNLEHNVSSVVNGSVERACKPKRACNGPWSTQQLQGAITVPRPAPRLSSARGSGNNSSGPWGNLAASTPKGKKLELSTGPWSSA
jgi:hypothetical protein